MTVITNANLIDLKIDLDIEDVWNEIRVLIPSYSWTYELIGEVWVKIADDYSQRYLDSESMNKYGRRTKTFNKQVMDSSFGEEYCYAEAERLKDPRTNIEFKIVGRNDTEIPIIFGMDLSDHVSCLESTSGFDGTGFVGSIVIDIDLDKIPRATIKMEEVAALDLLNWLRVDDGHVDGPEVVG